MGTSTTDWIQCKRLSRLLLLLCQADWQHVCLVRIGGWIAVSASRSVLAFLHARDVTLNFGHFRGDGVLLFARWQQSVGKSITVIEFSVGTPFSHTIHFLPFLHLPYFLPKPSNVDSPFGLPTFTFPYSVACWRHCVVCHVKIRASWNAWQTKKQEKGGGSGTNKSVVFDRREPCIVGNVPCWFKITIICVRGPEPALDATICWRFGSLWLVSMCCVILVLDWWQLCYSGGWLEMVNKKKITETKELTRGMINYYKSDVKKISARAAAVNWVKCLSFASSKCLLLVLPKAL